MIARTVPSGGSPGWLGMVVRRCVKGCDQISWEPAAVAAELEAESAQAVYNLAVAKTREAAH